MAAAQYPDLEVQLRELMRPALIGRGKRAKLAGMLKVAGQSYINQWIDEERQNPDLNKLPAIAEFVGLSVPELIRRVLAGESLTSKIPVQETTGVTYPGRADDQESPSEYHTGDLAHADSPAAQTRDRKSDLTDEQYALIEVANRALEIVGTAKLALGPERSNAIGNPIASTRTATPEAHVRGRNKRARS